ncbi:hypothetical protein THAOC_36829, partial [Thalassiosira oceanica]
APRRSPPPEELAGVAGGAVRQGQAPARGGGDREEVRRGRPQGGPPAAEAAEEGRGRGGLGGARRLPAPARRRVPLLPAAVGGRGSPPPRGAGRGGSPPRSITSDRLLQWWNASVPNLVMVEGIATAATERPIAQLGDGRGYSHAPQGRAVGKCACS